MKTRLWILMVVLLTLVIAVPLPVGAQDIEMAELPVIPVSVDRNRMQVDFVAAWSPDGSLLATVSDRNLVQIWDVETGQERVRLEDIETSAVAFSPDGKLLAVAGTGSNLLVLYLDDLLEVKVLSGDNIESVAREGKAFRNFLLLNEDDIGIGILDVAFTPDSSALLVQMGTSKLIDIHEPVDIQALLESNQPQSTTELTLPEEIQLEPGQMAAAADGIHVVTFASAQSEGKYVYTLAAIKPDWDAGTVSLTDLYQWKSETRATIKLSANGSSFGALSATHFNLRLLDSVAGTDTLVFERQPVAGGSAPALGVFAINADGKLLAGVYQDGTIKLWDSAGTELLDWSAGPLIGSYALSFSPDGSKLILITREEIRVWALSGDLVTASAAQTTPLEPAGTTASGDCANIDLNATMTLLEKAQMAAAAGDNAAAVGLMADAREQLTGFEAVCSVVKHPDVRLGEPYTIKTDQLSLTLNYPPGWVMDADQTDGIVFASSQTVLDEKGMSQPEPPAYEPGEALVAVLVVPPTFVDDTDSGDTASVVTLAQDLADGVDSDLGQAGAVTALSLGGRDSAKFTITSGNFDASFILVDLGTVDSGSRQLAVVIAIAAPGELPGIDAIAQAMAESFRLN